jgi:hypothetical protein
MAGNLRWQKFPEGSETLEMIPSAAQRNEPDSAKTPAKNSIDPSFFGETI